HYQDIQSFPTRRSSDLYKDIFKNEIFNREKQSTTGVGDGIAIPHAKTKAVKQPAIAFGRSIDGIDYEALDGQPSHLIFMIAAPEDRKSTRLNSSHVSIS